MFHDFWTGILKGLAIGTVIVLIMYAIDYLSKA